MQMKTTKTALAAVLAAVVGIGFVRAQDAPKSTAAVPAVAGDWTGDWGMYSPPPKSGEIPAQLKKMMYPETCKAMDCKVEALPDGKFQATFQGECGRPYKYTIKMVGRPAGGAVMFQGSADLGEKDGGVYDWIGRADGKEFIGFFTSQGHTGTFRLARPGAGSTLK